MNSNSTVGAYDQDSNLVFIEDAIKKRIYTCPGCRGELIPVKGRIYDHHYRHKVTIDSCSGPMTMLHKLAQDILLKMTHLHMPASYFMDHKVHAAHKLPVTNMQEEPSLKDTRYRPDLIFNSLGRDIWIEVTVTHETTGDKLQYIKDNDIICIELDLSEVNRVTSREALSVICRDPDHVSYLNNPKVRDEQEKIRERILKFSADTVRRDEWKHKETKRVEDLKNIAEQKQDREQQEIRERALELKYWNYRGDPISMEEWMANEREIAHDTKAREARMAEAKEDKEAEDKEARKQSSTKRITKYAGKPTGVYYKGVWKTANGYSYNKAKYQAYHYRGIDKLWKIICHKEAYGVEIKRRIMIIKKVISGKVITKKITLNDAFLEISTEDQARHVRSLFE